MSICIAVGGAVGYFNCLATQLQQFMCSRGYSDEFSGQHKFHIFLQNLLVIAQCENICKKPVKIYLVLTYLVSKLFVSTKDISLDP